MQATGGGRATGGATGQGGAVATGGTQATGGATGQGGSTASGGTTGNGGSVATGAGGHGQGGTGNVATGSGGHGQGGTGAATGGSTGQGSAEPAGPRPEGPGPAHRQRRPWRRRQLVHLDGRRRRKHLDRHRRHGLDQLDRGRDNRSALHRSERRFVGRDRTAAVAHPTVHVVAIVNPSDGPGSSKNSGYTTGIAALQAAGIKVIGYVATGYGSHSIASMEAEMDTWKSFYPTVQGIFFDEQSNSTGDVAHYQTLSQYAKSIGLGYTVGNPGTGRPRRLRRRGRYDANLESDGVPPLSICRVSAYPPSNFGVIPYAVSSMNTTFVQQARQYAAYIYLTNDDLPNPWDSLPSYFAQLLAALE